jgi:hypothetical protein
MDKLLKVCMAINELDAENPIICLDNNAFEKYKEKIPEKYLKSITVNGGEGFVFADVCFYNTKK